MADRDLLKDIEAWIKHTPENEVRAALSYEGVGATTIRRLMSGTYDNHPGPMLKKAFGNILRKKAS